jgi:hypothetical protein
MFEAAGSSAFGGFEYRKGAGDDHITKFIWYSDSKWPFYKRGVKSKKR